MAQNNIRQRKPNFVQIHSTILELNHVNGRKDFHDLPIIGTFHATMQRSEQCTLQPVSTATSKGSQ
jgi:hypothetical protein